MKKILYLILFLLTLSVGIKTVLADVSLDVTPINAQVGDKVNVGVFVSNLPATAKNILLYISDTVVDPKKLEDATAHLKISWPVGQPKYWYLWDTAAAESNPGLHYINAFVVDANNIVVESQTKTYQLAPGPSPTPSGRVSPTNTASPTPTPSSSSVTGNIGDIGTIIFPPTKITSIRGLIVAIIDWLLALAGALAVIAIIYSGIMYITAGGDPTKAEGAKKNLIWAIIGVVVIALALVIVNTVVEVLQGNAAPSPTPTPSVSASTTVSPSPSASPSPSPSPS